MSTAGDTGPSGPYDEALAFVREHPRVVLATARTDGRPQLSPVLVAVDEADRLVVSTREAAVKVRHLRRDPYVSIIALSDAFFGPWYQLEGEVEVVELPEAMEGLVAYYRSISGEHPDWDEYRAAMQRDRRVLLRITVTRTGPG